MLSNNTMDQAEDLAAAVREQRRQALEFVSNWRNSSQNLEQQLLSQLEATARELADSVGGELSEDDLQRRQSELAEERMRLDRLQEELAQRQTQQRQQHEQFSTKQESLLERLSRQSHEIDQKQAALAEREAAVRERSEQLAKAQTEKEESLRQQMANMQQAQAEFEKQSSSLAAQLEQFKQRERQLSEGEAQLQQQRSEFSHAHEQLQQQQASVAQEFNALSERARQLDERQQALAERAAQTEATRKQLARELKVRRAEQLVEIDRKRAELEQIAASEDADIERQLIQLQDELRRLNQQTKERGEQAEELQRQLEAARAQIEKRDAQNRELTDRLEQIAASDQQSAGETAALVAQLAETQEKAESQSAASHAALAQARSEQQQLKTQLQQAQARFEEAQQHVGELEKHAEELQAQIKKAGDAEAQKRIRELEQERDALVERLSEAEQVGAHSGGGAEVEELKGRLEMAMDDVRRLKKQNTELEARVKSGGAPETALGMDWEAQKKRMLAQLESDFDEDDPEAAEHKLTVEGTINITDQVVAQKDREIEELQRLLEDQSKNIEGVAVGASAIAEMMDNDELLRQEREKLEVLQQEWREKLRKAEIDISVERAKIARERAELEDKLQTLKQANTSDAAAGGNGDGKKPKRSRWLTRLGLGDDGDQ